MSNAKEDTVFLAGASLDEDASQHLADLTAVTGGGYELLSARGAITGETGREIYVRCAFDEDAEVTLVAHHSPDLSDETWRIGTNASSQFELRQNGSAVWTSTESAFDDVSMSWSTRPNPDTTGTSDALLSEVVIYDHDNDELLIEQFTHAVPTTSTGWTLSVGGRWDASKSLLAGKPVATPTAARIGKAWHPHTEVLEDWDGARTAYAGDLDDGIVEPLPITVASGLGDTPEFVGRANAGFTAAHSRSVERRTWSPLANECYRAAPSVTTTLARHLLTMPGSTAYKSSVFSLRWVPVPPGATHAWVRVQVQSWVTSGAAVPVGVRCYAMNRPPVVALGGLQNQPAPPLDVAYRGQVITVDHGASGTGEWLDLGLVRLPIFDAPIPGWRDTVHLCLAYAIDPANASTNDTAARLAIHAWNVQPVQQWTPGGLFGG